LVENRKFFIWHVYLAPTVDGNAIGIWPIFLVRQFEKLESQDCRQTFNGITVNNTGLWQTDGRTGTCSIHRTIYVCIRCLRVARRAAKL